MSHNPQEYLGYWCNMAAQAFRAHLGQEVQQFDLKWFEAILLLMLYRGPSSLVEISKYLEHAHPSVLRHIDTLEQAGLLERSVHPDDRRVKIVSLTEQGVERAKQVQQIAKQIQERATAGFTPEKTQTAISLLREIIENLGGHLCSEKCRHAWDDAPPDNSATQ